MDWDVFWSVFIITFVVVPLFFIWGFAIVDLFGRSDLGGLGKVLWLLAIIFFPLLGTLAYYLFRPAIIVPITPEDQAVRAGYVAEKLSQLTALHEKGVISDDEFNKQRSRVLAVST
jgi:hypothetical protein